MHPLYQNCKNIYAVGKNYAKHIEEMGGKADGEAVVFAKSPSALCTGDRVHFPPGLGEIHHELELVVRIGKHVPLGQVVDLSPISHIALGLDFTARDMQSRFKASGKPWHLSKNFHNSAWVGEPVAFKPDQAFTFTLHINGEQRQEGNTHLMIHDFQTILKKLNAQLDLHEGDLIYTGTPEGVGPVIEGNQLTVACPQIQQSKTLTFLPLT